MTTTLAPPDAVATAVPRSTAGPQVSTLLLVPSGTPRALLAEVLDAVAAQTHPPDRLVVVVAAADTSDPASDNQSHDRTDVADAVRGHEALAAAVAQVGVVHGSARPTLSQAVRCALGDAASAAPDPAQAEAAGPEWLWLLDTHTLPSPAALQRLVEAVRRSRSVGVAGPKVVQAKDPRRLVELGRQLTRTGRLIDAPAYGEADQGQYDTRTDVLAVGLPGMLLSRQVHDQVGGFDPAFAGAGADLDLGWRAQLAGHRVVVVPDAVVHTVDTADRARRRAQRRAARAVALTRCSVMAVPLLAAWILVSSVASALALLLLKRPRHALDELGDIGALFLPVRSAGARWRFRRGRAVRRRHLSALFVGAGSAAGHAWDRVQEALTPERDDPSGPAVGTDQGAEPGPVAEEAEALTGLPPSLPQRIVTHPGFLAVLVCAALSALMFRTALTQGLLDAQGSGLAGGELRLVSTDSGGLWHQFRDAWHGAGFGNALDVSPAVGVLAGLTWLVELVPYVDTGRSPAAVTLGWLVLAAMPLSALTAYLAGRVATRARWGRGFVALGWGTSGVLAAALTQGRVSVVVAHILLPLVVGGFASAMKRRGTWTATFAATLAAAVLGAFVPVLLAVVVLAATVVVIVGPGLRRRLRGLLLIAVPGALLGPWVLRFVAEPRLLLTGPGLLDVSTDSTPTWQIALAQPDGGRRLLAVVFVPLLVVAVMALARRAGGRPRVTALSAMAALACLGLAVALASERVEVGQAVDDSGALAVATLWAGVGLELYVAAVLGILLTGWHGLSHVLGEARWGWRRFLAGGVVSVLAAAVLVGGALSAWAGSGALRQGENALPAVAVDQANGPQANRLVVITPGEDRLELSLFGNEPGQLMRDVDRAADVTDPGLATVLGTIASGGTAGPVGAGDALADLGVGFVSLRAASDSPLARTLDASAGLTRLGSGGDQTLWRVVARPSSVAADVPVPPARVRLDDAAGHPLQAVPVDGPHGAVSQDLSVGPAGRSVVFAEAPQWASHAVVTFDGRRLTPVSPTGPPSYLLPAAPGRLEADLPPSHPRWFMAQLALLGVVVFLAVPFGTRRSRRPS